MRVLNLRTGDWAECEWSLSPRETVIAAHAQLTMRDWSTWGYEKRYGHLVETGDKTVAVGDWACLLTGKEGKKEWQ